MSRETVEFVEMVRMAAVQGVSKMAPFEFGQGAGPAPLQRKDEAMADELEEMERDVLRELTYGIGNFVTNEQRSTIFEDIQPTTSIIEAMAKAATQVLIAFERGLRIGS